MKADKEIDRTEYLILKILKKKSCVSYHQSMTLSEIMETSMTERVTTYRKMTSLCKRGLVDKGCQSGKAATYFIKDDGIDIVEREERRLRL
jgi:DNA-binding IclR family transcriptional regulator